MTDPYIVASYGKEWFVIHVPTEHVAARCDNRIQAIGIAETGNMAAKLFKTPDRLQ